MPPEPGMVPMMISGWPNSAFSPAKMMSHIMASSQPPPSAKPFTAAMMGVLASASADQFDKKLPLHTSLNVLFCISLMSAPAAKARVEPVSTMQAICGWASNVLTAALSSSMSSAHRALSALGRLS